MDCPKCGFQQPQDAYCARCGVNISQELTSRQRRNLVALLVTLMGIVAGVFYFAGQWGEEQDPNGSPAPQGLPPLQRKMPLDQTQKELAAREEKQSASQPIPPAQVGENDVIESMSTTGETVQPPVDSPTSGPRSRSVRRTKEAQPSEPQPAASESPPDEIDPEEQIRRWAAQEWFNKGQELSDFSDQEMDYYQRAIEVDSDFAPAYYYTGLIHLEWGDREAAVENFRRFWQDATREERQLYVLPDDITLEEVGSPAPTE